MTTFQTTMRQAAMASALLLFAGCGAMTSAPVLDDSARIDTNGAAQQSSTMPIDTPAETPGGGVQPDPAPVPDTFDATSRSTEITSTSGGTVTNGRWKLVVPSGAFAGTARVAISTPNSKAWDCRLGILPATTNTFDVPAMLVVDCHTVTPRQLAKWALFRYDTGSATWVRVPDSTIDLKKKTVTAPVMDFSSYKVGLDHGPLTL
jgi:hypothetical protein